MLIWNETIRSEMCVPIRIGQRIIGVINIESVQRGAFSASDERLITICAGQLATAIEQLRTEAKEQRRHVWLEKVLDLGKAISQITDWDICVRQIHHIARHELGFDRVGLFRYEPAVKPFVDYSVQAPLVNPKTPVGSSPL